MKQIRAPEFLNNLYRDMRDRRLLLPAAALVVCLIAVPQLLSSSSTTAPSPTVPIESAGKPTAAEPAVVTDEPGVTNYRKRLEQFKSKNPFRQQFTEPEITQAAVGAALTAPSTGSSGTTSSTSTTSTFSTSSTSTAPVISSTDSSTTSTTEPTSTTSDTGGTGSSQASGHKHHQQAPKPVTELIQRHIDVQVGRASNMRKKTDVEQLTFLPYAGKPLVAYLGTSDNGKKAFFLVSSDVSSARGDGHCLNTSSSSTCQYLTLKEGQVESFDYSPDPAATYKLKLLRVRDVVVSKTHG